MNYPITDSAKAFVVGVADKPDRAVDAGLGDAFGERDRSRRLAAEDYKNRNVVERAFNHVKNWRDVATRYDKHALVYRGGVVLAAILLWLS